MNYLDKIIYALAVAAISDRKLYPTNAKSEKSKAAYSKKLRDKITKNNLERMRK